jgi:hypothetical protein
MRRGMLKDVIRVLYYDTGRMEEALRELELTLLQSWTTIQRTLGGARQ